MRALILIIFCLLGMNQGFGAEKPGSPKLKLGFVPNKGQYPKGIIYNYKGRKLDVQLRESGFSYLLYETKESAFDPLVQTNPELPEISVRKIDIELLGSNKQFEAMAFEPGEGELYFHSPVNIEETYHVNHYKKVLYQHVYPNIDLEFIIESSGNEVQNFKYNFILHPGANPNLIQLKINGAERIKIKKDGSLEMKTGKGSLEEKIPMSYELDEQGLPGRKVHAFYKSIGLNKFGFHVDTYDPSKTLVIDPIAWSTYYGGSFSDLAQGIATDNFGNVILLGQTLSPDGISTVGSQQPVYSGGSSTFDVFLAKFDTAGVLKWATYFGGTSDDNSKGVVLDDAGNIYITGQTFSTGGISTAASFQPSKSIGQDGFVAKYTSFGGLVWSSYFGYDGTDQLLAICLDQANDIYVVGASNSVASLVPGVYQSVNAGNYDGVISKISNDGVTVKGVTYFGGTSSEYIRSLCIDKNKNIYFSGYTSSANGIANPKGYKQTNAGGMDGFYGRIDSSLVNLTFGSFFGGTGTDYIFDIMMDADGKLVMSGFTGSSTGISTVGAFQTTYGGGNYDAFLLRTDTAGVPIWCTYFGGANDDYFYSLCTDPGSNYYLFGLSSTTTGMATAGAFQPTFGGGSNDALLVKFNSSGARIWSSYFGGNGNDVGREITCSPQNDLFLFGESYSTSGVTTSGVHQTVLGGTNDVFLARYKENITPGNISNNSIRSDQGLCLGKTAQVLIGTTPSGGIGIYTYLWLMSNTGLAGSYTTASGTNNTSTYAPGALVSNRYYRRVVYSGAFTDTSNMVSIVVSTSLEAGFTVNKTIQCLKNNQFIFADTTTNSSGTLAYNWDFGNGKTSSKQIDTITYDASVDNLFKVRLVTTLNGGCADTNSINVIIINNPQAKTVIGPDTVMKGTTSTFSTTYTNGSSYIWSFGKGTGNSSTISINIKWTDIGDDTVKMLERNGGGCNGDTVYKLVYIKQPTGIEAFGLNQSIRVYPNPGEGLFTLENESEEELKAEVYTLSGQRVNAGMGKEPFTIDLRNEPSGIYLLRLSNAKGECLHTRIQIMR